MRQCQVNPDGVYRRDPPRVAVHCRGCLRGFASRSMRPLAFSPPPPLQFFATDPEKGVRRPISPQFPIRFSLVLLEFRFVDIAIQLNTCFLRARKFYRISLKFHSFLFPFFRFIRNIRIFFTFFCLETSPHFANFSMIFFEFEKNNARC